MAWIESHQELGQHPKTKRLAKALRIHAAQVVGHLHFLWWWALDYADDGILHEMGAEEIADAAGWPGDGQEFLSAMLAVRFLDNGPDGLVIHDWWQYAGKLVSKRRTNAERMREARAAAVQRTCIARAGATVPTVPTVPTEPTNHHLRGEPNGSQKRALRDSVPTERPAVTPKRRGAEPTEQQTAVAPRKRGGQTVPAELVRPVFAVLARRCGYETSKLTDSERGEINRAAVGLVVAEYSAEDANLMANNWPIVMGDCLMTPSAIAKHATRLRTPPPNNGRERFGRKPVSEAPPDEEYSEAKHRN